MPRGPVYLSLPRETLAAPWGDAALAVERRRRARRRPRVRTRPRSSARRICSPRRGARSIISAAFTTGAGLVLGAFADRFAMPVVEQWSPTNAIATDHPMHAGFDPGELLGEADVVLVLDVPVPWVPSRQRPAPGAAVIQIGARPQLRRSAAARSSGDARDHVGGRAGARGAGRGARSPAAPWRETSQSDGATPIAASGAGPASSHPAPLRARHDEMAGGSRRRASVIARARARSTAAPAPAATKAWISRHLDRAIAPELDEGRAWLFHELGCDPSVMRFPKPDTLFGLSIAGALGWALPAALGAQLAARDQIVVAAVGDGSYTFANPVACHQMAAQLDLPVLTVVFDNQGWQAVRMATLAIYPQGHAAQAAEMPLTSLAPSPDYAKVIEASGGHGERVDDPSWFSRRDRARARRGASRAAAGAGAGAYCRWVEP